MKDYELEDYIADLKIELDDAEMETPRNEYIRTHRHNEDKPVSNSPTCWGTLQDEEFTPAFTSVPKVPAGIYEVVWNRQLNQNTLKKQPFKTDELYQLPSYEITDILKDIQNFWDRRDKYKEYNFVHKRGILMYGEPGCGKSGIIQLIAKQLIENDGIIINIKDQDDVDYFMDFIATFRKIEPNRPLIVLLEDIDSIASENSHSTSRLLNIEVTAKKEGYHFSENKIPNVYSWGSTRMAFYKRRKSHAEFCFNRMIDKTNIPMFFKMASIPGPRYNDNEYMGNVTFKYID